MEGDSPEQIRAAREHIAIGGLSRGAMLTYRVGLCRCLDVAANFCCFSNADKAGLPDALVESARIDGAGDLRAYWQIIFPLCTPVLATVALFVAVGAWNSWFDTYLYCGSEKDLYTLQYILKMKLATTQNSANAAQTSVEALKNTTLTTPVTIRCSITVISTVPILIVYPFLQKYFVTGMALGAVKG